MLSRAAGVNGWCALSPRGFLWQQRDSNRSCVTTAGKSPVNLQLCSAAEKHAFNWRCPRRDSELAATFACLWYSCENSIRRCWRQD